MTKAQDFASKLAVAFVAVAMVVSAFAPSAKAQSSEDLQKMINDLLAQVAALQGQVGQGSTGVASGVCPYTWTRDLSSGAKGGDVMKLQQFLNADPDTRVAATGAGSVGAETEFYGPATAAAVSKFQVKYRSEILSPAGLVNPTGYFGPSSRTSANAKCVVAPVVDTDDGDMEEDEDTDEEDETVTLSGEASLDEFTIDDADDSTVQEGDEDVEIGMFTVVFADGDASISRIDLALQGGGDETDPWDTFDTVSLWVDGDKVAEKSADRRSDYLDEDDGSLRFSGLDLIGMEDEKVEIVVAATLQSGMDDGADGEDWELFAGSLRFFDADGVATTETSTGDLGDLTAPAAGGSAAFTIEEAGYDDEIIVKTSSNDPDSTTLQVQDDSKSDWYTVFVFDLDTDDSINDITLNDVYVDVTMGSGTYATFVDDAELVIDGEVISSKPSDVANPTTLTGTIHFDVDGDVTIDAGDRVEAELRLRFKALTVPGNEGVTVMGAATVANVNAIDAEGADDLSNSPTDQLRGSAQGDAHTLRTSGLDVSKESTSAVVTVQDLANNDYGTYTIEVEVTAFEQDVYVSTNPALAMTYLLQDGTGSTSIAGTRSVVLTSTADESGAYFEVTEGETETFTLTMTYTPGVAGTQARFVLSAINFASSASPADQTQSTLPATDYRTSVITMVN